VINEKHVRLLRSDMTAPQNWARKIEMDRDDETNLGIYNLIKMTARIVMLATSSYYQYIVINK